VTKTLLLCFLLCNLTAVDIAPPPTFILLEFRTSRIVIAEELLWDLPYLRNGPFEGGVSQRIAVCPVLSPMTESEGGKLIEAVKAFYAGKEMTVTDVVLDLERPTQTIFVCFKMADAKEYLLHIIQGKGVVIMSMGSGSLVSAGISPKDMDKQRMPSPP
jgi:hypothetical protein